jgi:hypothetical protein
VIIRNASIDAALVGFCGMKVWGLSFGLPKHDLPARLRIGSRKPVRHVGRHVCIIGTLDQQHRRRLSEAPASAMMRCGLASAIASSVPKNA